MSNGYYTKFIIGSIDAHPDLSISASWTMNMLALGTEDITIDASFTIGSIFSSSVATATYSNQSVNYGIISSYTSDVYFQTNGQSFSSVENNVAQKSPNLPCSSSGSTSITFSISNYLTSAPSWITVDSLTGKLFFTAPDINMDTEYDFYIDSTISGASNPVQKLIKLTIKDWSLQNWQHCLITSSLSWGECNIGFDLVSSNWISQNSDSNSSQPQNSNTISTKDTASESAQGLRATSVYVIGTSFGIVTFVSLFNTTSMSSLWSMMHQIQLFFLLLLTRAYIPIDVRVIITGLKIVLDPPKYFQLENFPYYNTVMDGMVYNLNNSILESLCILSNSTIYNLLPMFILIWLIGIFHSITFIIVRIFSRRSEDRKQSWMLWIIKWSFGKLFMFLTFSWYIRYILEMNQYMLISSINEIFNFDTSTSLRIISVCFAFLILSFWLSLIVLTSKLTFSAYESIEGGHNKIGEFFNGVKMEKKSKLYVVVLLIRRFVYVFLLISLVSIQSWILISVLSILQFGYALFIIILRPFKEIRCNLIEILNELYFIVLLSALIFLNKKEDWNNTITTIYMGILSSNTLMAFVILFSKC